jgi:hypothetical protein
MRNAIVRAAVSVGVLASGLFGASAPAQAPRPKPDSPPLPVVLPASDRARLPAEVGQIEIYNGPRRTVQYVAPSLSAGEQASLRDLARAENEAAYANEALALKRSYVDSERLLEPYRRSIQQRLYGFSSSSSFSGYASGGYGGYGAYGGYGYAPYAYSNPYSRGWGGSFYGGETTDVSHSLANGMGDEGVMKQAMASQIASQATPDYAQGAGRAVDLAYARVASSDRLAKGFGLTRSNVVPAAAETTRMVLTLKGGEKLDGTLQGEDADWFRLETATGTVSVRKADVSRIEVPKK